MTQTRKPTKSEEQQRREINMDRDMRDMVVRLTSIEASIRNIESRDAVIAALEFKNGSVETRLKALEDAKSSVIKLVMGTVGVAILALVVGKGLT